MEEDVQKHFIPMRGLGGYFNSQIWASLPVTSTFCDMMVENSNFLNADDL